MFTEEGVGFSVHRGAQVCLRSTHLSSSSVNFSIFDHLLFLTVVFQTWPGLYNTWGHYIVMNGLAGKSRHWLNLLQTLKKILLIPKALRKFEMLAELYVCTSLEPVSPAKKKFSSTKKLSLKWHCKLTRPLKTLCILGLLNAICNIWPAFWKINNINRTTVRCIHVFVEL